MNNQQIREILETIFVGLLVFGLGVAIGLYATHPLAYINIVNNTVKCAFGTNTITTTPPATTSVSLP